MEKTLLSDWFDYFRRKLISEFNLDIKKSENYQPDISPLIYCCIQHKRIAPRKRAILLSNSFKESKMASSEEWRSLRAKIESGDDINGYMSKKVNDWQSIDYLLGSCNITHFHLYKNQDGGTREWLIFGIFTKEHFYALKIGNHNDLYNADALVSITASSWPDLDIFRVRSASETVNSTFDSRFFKKVANDPRLQYNMISPVVFTDHEGQQRELDNHQNTALTNLTLNNIDIGRIPIMVYIAYANEANYLIDLDARLYDEHRAKRMSLTVNDKRGEYTIEIHRRCSLKKIYRIPRRRITCSLYEKFK
ncbi:hypothetical protein NUV66_07790 [Pseudomonas sp. 32.2.56]|uniref:hypothetical protein n=1 Tax=Pseudomonas sp. 32.2.56 TaxID=2969303 RepID=UPI00214FB77E|nr:hypothetical protein [Pseudomonas sp. 32.2.56]MCR4509204.1 hypothetical protein [Pseudomonas sp. 32.2.56]